MAKIYNLRAIERDSLLVLPLYNSGIIYYREINYDSAIILFNKALLLKTQSNYIIYFNTINNNVDSRLSKFDIKSFDIIFMLGLSNYYKRNLINANYFFNYLITNGYYLKDSFFYRGAIFLESKHNDKACIDFQNAKALGNTDVELFIEKYCISN